VLQVDSIRDPERELSELHCKTNPFPRTYFAGGYLQDRVWLFGGMRSFDDNQQDSWYRCVRGQEA
jgi:hypothetical protein